MRRLGRVPLLAVVVAAALAHFLVPAAAPAIAVGADLFRLHHCFSFFWGLWPIPFIIAISDGSNYFSNQTYQLSILACSSRCPGFPRTSSLSQERHIYNISTCTRKSMTFAYLLSTHRVNQYKKAMPPMTINPPMIVRPYIWPISHWLAEKEAV